MKKLHILLLATTLICGSILNAAEPVPADTPYDASINTIEKLFKAVRENNLKKVKRYIKKKKIDVNIHDEFNFTPLHIATAYSKLSIAKFLLNHGAHSNALDTDNDTPLHMLARRFHSPERPMVLMLQLLLNYGADLTIQNRDNIEPSFYIYPPTTTSEQEADKLLIAARNIDAHKESDEDTILLPNRRKSMRSASEPKVFLPDVVI